MIDAALTWLATPEGTFALAVFVIAVLAGFIFAIVWADPPPEDDDSDNWGV